MAIVAQSVRASDCGSEGCGFDSRHSPFAAVAQLVEHHFGKVEVRGFDTRQQLCPDSVMDSTTVFGTVSSGSSPDWGTLTNMYKTNIF